VGLVAIPGAMLVLSDYVDLLVGSITVLASVVFGRGWNSASAWALDPVWLGGRDRLGRPQLIPDRLPDFSPIIVTLGGLAGARGLAQLITHGSTQFGFGPTFAILGNGLFLAVPVPVWIYVSGFLESVSNLLLR